MDPPRKKRSLWNWAPIRALARFRHHPFLCTFPVFVQTVEGLPIHFNGSRLMVQFQRKDRTYRTMPSRVHQGIAEFDETLHVQSTIYGQKTGFNCAPIKYMRKEFVLSVVALDMDELLLSSYRIDLSRLLPAFVEDFWEPNKPMSSTTSFKLTGKAEGGVLVVTFDFEVLNEELRSPEENASARFTESPIRRALRAFKSLPNSPRDSAFGRRSNHHCASPCTSDLDLNDSRCMDDSSLEERGEWSSSTLQQCRSPEEERYLALENDPLNLDSFVDTGPVAPSTPVKSQEGLEFVDDSSADLHLGANDSSSYDEEIESSGLIETTEFNAMSLQDDTDLCPTRAGFNKHKVDCTLEVDDNRMLLPRNDKDKTSSSSLGSGIELYHMRKENVACDTIVPQMLESAPVEHPTESLGFGEEEDLEEVLQFLTDCAEDGITKHALDMDEVFEHDLFSLEADAVASDFIDLLEREEIVGISSQNSSICPQVLSPNGGEEEVLLQEDIQLSLNEPSTLNCSLVEKLGITQCTPFPLPTGSMCLNNSDKHASHTDATDDLELLYLMEAAESEMEKAVQTLRSKARAKMLEDAETNALLKEWGLSGTAFESPRCSPDSWSLPSQPPPAVCLLSTIKLKDGGSLRAMTLDHFQSQGSLVMQVSAPIVLPAKMGSSVVDVLSHMASKGLDNMVKQAFAKMPLEDLTGLTLGQYDLGESTALDMRHKGIDGGGTLMIPRQGSARSKLCESTALVARVQDNDGPCNFHKIRIMNEDAISVGDLIHISLKKIEALVIEGLKIQCDMAEETRYRINPFCLDVMNESENKSGQYLMRLEASSYLPTDRTGGEEQTSGVDCMLDMAISLEEWIHLNAEIQKAQYSATAISVHNQSSSLEKTGGDSQNLIWGTLNGALTVVMLVQLHDPHRYYEPVGAPLMALVQAERVTPRFVNEVGGDVEMKDSHQYTLNVEQLDQLKRLKLRITGVHVSGLQILDDSKTKGWCNNKQLQSGSQWLFANFVAKNPRHALLKAKHVRTNTELREGERLWSISALDVSGTGWRHVAEFCPYIRNPDIFVGS